MFNNVALDVFIGLVFVFLLYSLLATILQEIIATRFAFRAKVLEKAILRMLEDGKTTQNIPYLDRIEGVLHIFNLKSLMKGKKVAPWFYAHPLIKYLAEDNWYSKPAYITPANFSKVILDLLKGMDQPASQSLQLIHDSIMKGAIRKIEIKNPDMANPAVKKLTEAGDLNDQATVAINESTAIFLRSLWEDSGGDLNVFQQKLEQWFNDTMERATGWFKKYTQIVLFILGFILAWSFNVDSIAIKRILTTNKTAREQMVAMAIANYEKINPGAVLARDSNLLDSTYKLIAADAEKANNILGLGRPWKDTLNMWRDSVISFNFQNRFMALKQRVPILTDSMENFKAALNRANLSIATLTLQREVLKKSADLNSINQLVDLSDSINRLEQHIQKTHEVLLKISATLKEYKRMSLFKERSEYIEKTIGDRWFVYSPNQAGGIETFLGWFITALAIMLGAPFWFDLLSKLISLRGTGTKISAEKNQGSKASVDASSVSPTSSLNNNADQEAVG
jgi:hypothetical protein